jgi:type II secretory pathway pseudopilin PulG
MVAGRNRGFTYLTVLFAVAILGGGLALVGELWHTAAMREKEARLLYAGSQYRKAIERYYLSGPRQYPRELAQLIRDPHHPGTVRHLRKLYPDPITGKDEWGLVRAPDGGVMGVHSLSEERPLKSAGFRARDKGFEGAQRYSDWTFVFIPAAAGGTAPKKPATPAR